MRCYQCVHWTNIKYDGIIVSGSCAKGPKIKYIDGEKLLSGFTVTNECNYPESFEKANDDIIQERQIRINYDTNKSSSNTTFGS